MSLRYRPMLAQDVESCAGIVAEHPVIGPRYGRAIADLKRAWLHVLGSDAMGAAVFEELEGRKVTLAGFGVGVFVNENFIREIKTASFWFGPELAKRVMKGSSPLLSGGEIRKANSGEGLNLLVWEAVPRIEFSQRPDIFHLMVSSFIEIYRGFRLKEMVTSQSESVRRLHWTVEAGGLHWDPANARYEKSLKGDDEEFIRKPHIIGITRELEFGLPGSWVGSLFDYHPPQLGFSPGEQRLLLAALSGATDEKLAEELSVSPSTVKNNWRSIYNRAALRVPALFSSDSQDDLRNSWRGKEKKRHLLAYLREHPEELRPVSQSLLRQNRPIANEDSSLAKSATTKRTRFSLPASKPRSEPRGT